MCTSNYFYNSFFAGTNNLQMALDFQATNPYLEGHGDLVSRLMIRRIRVTIWVIGFFVNLLTMSP